MLTRLRTWESFQNLSKQQCESMRYFNWFHHERHLFDKMPSSNIFSLRQSMIIYLREKRYPEALRIFKERAVCGIDEAILAMALKSCQGDQNLGSQIHGYVTTSGVSSCLSVSNSLISMYCKGGRFDQSLHLFHNLQNPDVVSWNAMLSGFKNQDGIDFACEMHKSGVVFDAVTYSSVLALCADHGEFFHFGIQMHSAVFKSGLFSEVFIGNALITMYSKEGKIIEAERVFDEMPKKDLVSWNAILSGYAQEGVYGVEAIWTFNKMLKQCMKLDHVSFTSVVSACGLEKKLELGRQVHSLLIKKGYSGHVSVCNVLLSMYSKCEQVRDAKLAFADMIDRNVISWTTMISIDEDGALNLFNQMRLDGVYPNNVTFVALIHAITTRNSVEQGRMVHCLSTKTNLFLEPNVANCLITMYAKFKITDDSRKIFDELDHLKGIVAWNALISGYAHNNQWKEAVQTFLLSKQEVKPNEYTLGSVLNAIAAGEAVSLRYGQRCHSYLFKVGFDSNPIVSGALLDMYAKRGSIYESRKVFSEMFDRSQVAWTAIISANSRHGDYESVLTLFNEMTMAGLKPDPITFLSILTACGRNGMVDKGLEIFNLMTAVHSVEPSEEHYACMVDMLGRAGRLKEAEVFASEIPGKPGVSTLQCLLGACRVHGNVEMGKRVAEALMEMEPKESGSYVLMSNLYAEKGEWEKVAKIRRRMRDGKVKKEIGFSWVDADDSLQLHGFSSDDKLHPQSEKIYVMAKYLGSEMKLLQKEGTFAHDGTLLRMSSSSLLFQLVGAGTLAENDIDHYITLFEKVIVFDALIKNLELEMDIGAKYRLPLSKTVLNMPFFFVYPQQLKFFTSSMIGHQIWQQESVPCIIKEGDATIRDDNEM